MDRADMRTHKAIKAVLGNEQEVYVVPPWGSGWTCDHEVLDALKDNAWLPCRGGGWVRTEAIIWWRFA